MFILEKRYVEEMIAYAKEENPNEACGLLAGHRGKVVKVYRCENTLKSPYRYDMNPLDFLRADQEMGEKGWDLLGIYHSHTKTEAYPSLTDIQFADKFRETTLALLSMFSSTPQEDLASLYPGPLYFIVSLADSEGPATRAFRIADGKIREEELKIEEEPSL